MVSGFDKRGTNYENVWEYGNVGQFWKGTREQGPPGRPSGKLKQDVLFEKLGFEEIGVNKRSS